MTSPPSTESLVGTHISFDKIAVDIVEKIGTGTHSIVYKATDSNGTNYAVKAMQAPDEPTFERYLKEFDFQKKCSSCPNIVLVFHQNIDKSARTIMILMEYCPENLTMYINGHSETGLDTAQIIEIFQSICAAVHFIHSQQPAIIHRNIQVENIYYNRNQWKLSGFGSATTTIYREYESADAQAAAQNDIDRSTTLLYRAPELLDLFRNDPIYMKVDIWSLGCLMYKLCTFKEPFVDVEHIQKAEYTWPGTRQVNPYLKSITKLCFETDPRRRTSVEKLLSKLYEYFPEYVDSRWQEKKTGKPFFQMPKNVSQTMPITRSRRKPIVFQDFKIDPNTEEDLIAAPRRVRFTSVVLSNGRKRLVPNHMNPDEETNKQNGPGHAHNENGDSQPHPKGFIRMNKKHAATANFSKKPGVQYNNGMMIVDPFADIPADRRVPFVLAGNNHPPSNHSNIPKPTSSTHYQQMSSSEASSVNNSTCEELTESSNMNDHFTDSHHTPQPENLPEVNAEDLLNQAKADHRTLIKKLLEGNDGELRASIAALIKISPAIGTRFLFKLIHKSRNTVARILRNTPRNPSAEVQAVLESRIKLAKNYPMFEGNLGLDTFKINYNSNKNKPGQVSLIGDRHSPLSTGAALCLLENLQATLNLLDKMAFPEFAEEGIISYQSLSYVILKLKIAKRADEVIINNVIPSLVKLHARLKPILRKLHDNSFPELPYNFDDPNSVKHLHCPTYIVVNPQNQAPK
ncbi:BMP-2-inducible protein kinase [Tritrichomonas musculus]|uniref:non-specific serine/threonine protein kinase n=1 Tax=Tritrichomonas musculus TaxID=1915356 RepID=A0ABR2K344_9EUKA